MEELETIELFALTPWESRIRMIADESDAKSNVGRADWAVCIAVSSSARNRLVGFGAAIEIRKSSRGDCLHSARAITLG